MFLADKICNRRRGLSLLSSLGFIAFLLLAQAGAALAATEPNLLTSATYGVLSSTFTRNIAVTNITGDLGYTTLSGSGSTTVSGTTHVADGPYATAGIDQGTALATLNGQSCTSLGSGAVALDGVNLGFGPGVFPPGCYSSGGAMDITLSTTVTLLGTGVYIFRPAGALTTGANSKVVATGGACESDVFWTPTGATTLGANASASLTPTFVGTIIDDAGITLGHFANLTGRALAFGGTVTADTNTITVPTCAAFVTPVTTSGQVSLGKVFSPNTIADGGVSRLTITLINNNVGAATLTAALVDTLPGGVVIAPTPNAITTCGVGTPTAVAGTSIVSLPIGTTIPGGAPGTCTVAVNVTAVAGGPYTNTLAIDALSTSNGNNTVAASDILTVTGVAVATTLSTVASSGVIVGGAISDTATLSGGNAPTGTITFNLYAPSDTTCAAAPVFTSIVPVSGNGSYSSASFTSAAIGTYHWIANYGGDLNNLPTANVCNAANESVAVSAAAAVSVPTLNEWGVIIFMLLAGLGSLYYIRKQRV